MDTFDERNTPMNITRIIPVALTGVVGLTAAGLITMGSPAVSADDAAKRDDDTQELVLVGDDDDDDTNDNTGDSNTDGDNYDTSRNTNDNTRSNFTGVSRDRDLSRGDKTRDWTRDGKGGDKTRDHSANQTNDRSRNDSRR
jgi:hypothetical protein